MFDFERSTAGQFLLNARAFAAELELEKLRERIQRGKLARLHAGNLPAMRKILARETYTSVGIAMRTRSTKVNGKRQRYVSPVEERTVLSEGTIPPLVPEDTFAAVQARLTVNKTEAARRNSNPEDFLLRGGFICCGYCGKVIAARSAYTDHTRPSMGPDCPLVWIDAATIDAAVWQRVNSILTKPETIAAEAAKRCGADPTVEERAAVGRVLTAVRRQQTNLARALASIDDEESAAPLVAELDAAGKRRRALEVEQATLARRQATWQDHERALDSLEAWCEKVSHGLERATYARKCQALTALGVRVKIYAVGHEPRWEFMTSLADGELILVDPTTNGGPSLPWRSAHSCPPSIRAS
jgi:hypothetical protein